ncbi:MAG: hypothetical protein QOD39_481 [Mycobacterium sp.]|nr:hypothetical protein [Mycobacterium sp.]
MTEPTRGARQRRGGRRPGWLLLTVLLVLAIGASSALVFTSRVELLKLAVILALWAAVVAAFVSVIYRRQSDMDQAKVRDLKLVYDLQLDREISARREYELSVETQLRRELESELRAQAADEMAGLRAELAALRANLEILFDADLSDRPALEFDRTNVRSHSEWPREARNAGRVTSSRIDTEDRDNPMIRTDESPIIDVPEEPHPVEYDWATSNSGGAHRLPSEMERETRRRTYEEPRAWAPPPTPPPRPSPPPQPPPQHEPVLKRDAQIPWLPPQEQPKPQEPPAPRQQPERVSERTSSADWRPAPAGGQWIPAGAPGSNWVAPAETAPPPEPYSPSRPAAENGASAEYVGRRRAPEPGSSPPDPAPADPAPQQDHAHAQPAMTVPPPELRRGRHSAPPEAVDPGRPSPPPTLAAEPTQPPPPPDPTPVPPPEKPRHRSADELDTGAQSVAELLARLQTAPTGGGRRRRRDD